MRHYLIALLLTTTIFSGCVFDEEKSGIEESIFITSPEPFQVFQRQADGTANISISGIVVSSCNQIDAQLVYLAANGSELGNETEWETIVSTEKSAGSTFVGTINANAGWFRLELRFTLNETIVNSTNVSPVGVGEVFITAGQSNSANYGSTTLTPTDSRVSSWGLDGWQFAVDPQPIATGEGGTPWPHMGDLLAQRYDVPIGLISVGWGATSVEQWLPTTATGDLFSRIELALEEVGPQGARAILWHQGESDLALKTSTEEYAQHLSEVINASRDVAGWELPWIVARASYLPSFSNESLALIIDAQQLVIDNDPLTYEGPYTDDMIGGEWRYDTVHFNEAGLIEHAIRWDESIVVMMNDL
ncbi:MAG: sialate O-acetylesterase [Candidatus Thalassarchaeaceae archaeon]|jgi:hypothetical protein|nr:sialate O-acetylesterase [Candidatus Thalassarchaeaceae archaeon]MDP6742432.1 sialate O-acetylesterase [Candidatus Thalassarchaeaceae archaeon]|tara:strand:+ start:62 stop:1144 length:1083 start_codon:yes stop_codon:yes gene_type:complete